VLSRSVLLPLAALALLLAACGSGGTTTDGASRPVVAVTASDSRCEVARTELTAGPVTFAATNQGSSVTEVYVYGLDDGSYTKVIGEVENIGPGTTRELDTTLAAGAYEVACKPGQTGDGIRTRIGVSGGSAAGGNEGGYDREIELVTDGTSLTGLDGAARAGEKIEFKLTNNATDERTLELKKPSGPVAAEVEVRPGATEETVVELGEAGTWQVVVEGGAADVTEELSVR
jgi:hypothetical protein